MLNVLFSYLEVIAHHHLNPCFTVLVSSLVSRPLLLSQPDFLSACLQRVVTDCIKNHTVKPSFHMIAKNRLTFFPPHVCVQASLHTRHNTVAKLPLSLHLILD